MGSPNDRHAVRVQIRDGSFHYKQCRIVRNPISDAQQAIALLRKGKVIWLLQDARLFNTVQREIEGRAG